MTTQAAVFKNEFSKWVLLAFLLTITLAHCPLIYSKSAPYHDIPDQFLERVGKQVGPEAKKRLQAWQNLMAEDKQNLTPRQKLKRVNDFFNRLTYKPDSELTGRPDYWQTPVEFLIRRP
jgi:predicted transglutaminase-like cysteine proteinase